MSVERLEVDDDREFQRREWRIQRIAWILWAGLIIAALAGLLGPGPMSNRSVSSSDARLTLTYNRFVRHHHPTTLELLLKPADEADDTLRLHLSRLLLDRIKVERIEPESTSQELTADGTWYVFRCEPGAASAKVLFHVEYESMGGGSGELRLAGSQAVVIDFFVYP